MEKEGRTRYSWGEEESKSEVGVKGRARDIVVGGGREREPGLSRACQPAAALPRSAPRKTLEPEASVGRSVARSPGLAADPALSCKHGQDSGHFLPWGLWDWRGVRRGASSAGWVGWASRSRFSRTGRTCAEVHGTPAVCPLPSVVRLEPRPSIAVGFTGGGVGWLPCAEKPCPDGGASYCTVDGQGFTL